MIERDPCEAAPAAEPAGVIVRGRGGRDLTRAQRRQRRIAPLKTGAHSPTLVTDRAVRLRFFGLTRSAWDRRIRAVARANPHLGRGNTAHPRYRPAIGRLLLMQEIFSRLAASIESRGLYARSGEPARVLRDLRAYAREILRLETALGLYADHPADDLALLLGGAP